MSAFADQQISNKKLNSAKCTKKKSTSQWLAKVNHFQAYTLRKTRFRQLAWKDFTVKPIRNMNIFSRKACTSLANVISSWIIFHTNFCLLFPAVLFLNEFASVLIIMCNPFFAWRASPSCLTKIVRNKFSKYGILKSFANSKNEQFHLRCANQKIYARGTVFDLEKIPVTPSHPETRITHLIGRQWWTKTCKQAKMLSL